MRCQWEEPCGQRCGGKGIACFHRNPPASNPPPTTHPTLQQKQGHMASKYDLHETQRLIFTLTHLRSFVVSAETVGRSQRGEQYANGRPLLVPPTPTPSASARPYDTSRPSPRSAKAPFCLVETPAPFQSLDRPAHDSDAATGELNNPPLQPQQVRMASGHSSQISALRFCFSVMSAPGSPLTHGRAETARRRYESARSPAGPP